MTPSEVAELLSLNGELDRFATADKMTKEKVVAWTAVIAAEAPQMTFSDAQDAVIKYYGTAGESLTVYSLIETWKQGKRLTKKNIIDDVRTAKARGLISKEWDALTPLPTHIAERLRELREADRRELIEAIEAGPSPLQLEVGRRV